MPQATPSQHKVPPTLPEAYEIRELSREQFWPLCEPLSMKIFEEAQPMFNARDLLTESEKEKAKALQSRMGDPFRLHLAVFYKNEFVGWSWGFQQSAETYYMCNSAILPEHRNKGLYTALMHETVRRVSAEGFQRIYSRHTATNNAVIIPKLKAGFLITHFEISDTFGVLVHLTLFPKELRSKVLNYRAGQILPDKEIQRLLRHPI
jgi:ribosomal protein S18 acetylase RimI-like enzyme